MRKFLSRSILVGAIARVGMVIVAFVFYDQLYVDLGILIFIWLSYAIDNGSVTACRWAVFLMLLGTVAYTVHVAGFFVDSPFITKGVPGGFEQLPSNLPLDALSCIWSLLNLVLAVIVLREEGEKAFTKPVIVGVSCVAGLLISIFVLSYLFTPEYARWERLEQRYAEQVALMRDIAAGQMDPSRNSSEVRAVFDEHPEILEAEVSGTGHRTNRIIFSSMDRIDSESFIWNTWLGSFGTVQCANDGSIPVVVYRGYARNAQGEWVEIKMVIKDIWGAP